MKTQNDKSKGRLQSVTKER